MKRKMLFIASTGGHLAQLSRLSSRFEPSDDSLWVTFRSPQSESLLQGRRTLFVPYIRPRDVRAAATAWRHIRRLLRQERFDEAVSTGAALAVPGLLASRAAKVKTTYIESVSRIEGPSLSGRIIHMLRVADLFTQHAGWAGGRWRPYSSVLTSFEAREGDHDVARPRLFITLGTIEGYRFDALVDAVLATGLADEHTVWQLGVTTRDGLPGTARAQMSASDFARSAAEADVVITHAGVGTILQLLESGIYPVVVPRRRAQKEHVDDHQIQIARLVDDIGVAAVAEPAELTAAILTSASRYSVREKVTGGGERARHES